MSADEVGGQGDEVDDGDGDEGEMGEDLVGVGSSVEGMGGRVCSKLHYLV